MASQWYYAIGDAENGPVSSQELKKLVDSGQLSPTDQVWKEGMAEWVAANTIPNLFSSSPSAGPSRTPVSGGAPMIDTGDSGPAVSFSEPSFGGGSRTPQPRRGRGGGSAQDYLTFKKMITPLVIQIVFWMLVALCLLGGLLSLARAVQGGRNSVDALIGGIVIILIGPLIIRIYCELLIVIFSINDTLFDIKNLLRKKS